MAGELFLGAIGQGATQGAANQALTSAGQGLLNNYMTMANPALNTGILSQLSNMGGNIWDVLGSEQTANVAGTAGNLFSGFNQYKQGKDYSKIFKSQEARAADAYARDKEADKKRQLLTF